LTAAATAGNDALAAETVELFATYLGRYAGDLALIFMPSGGVFIGGGVAPVIAARLRSGGFRDAFVNKPPREAILRTFATAIIMHPAAALAGIRALIVRPEDYAVDLEGRWWR
jgi:glucokinase